MADCESETLQTGPIELRSVNVGEQTIPFRSGILWHGAVFGLAIHFVGRLRPLVPRLVLALFVFVEPSRVYLLIRISHVVITPLSEETLSHMLVNIWTHEC
jgi:hypothetical protein